jgi:hypothetical protein
MEREYELEGGEKGGEKTMQMVHHTMPTRTQKIPPMAKNVQP